MNMTNINNDLAAGKDVRFDFNQMQNFAECAHSAKQSGDEITLFNIDGVQPSVLAQYTSQATGQVSAKADKMLRDFIVRGGIDIDKF